MRQEHPDKFQLLSVQYVAFEETEPPPPPPPPAPPPPQPGAVACSATAQSTAIEITVPPPITGRGGGGTQAPAPANALPRMCLTVASASIQEIATVTACGTTAAETRGQHWCVDYESASSAANPQVKLRAVGVGSDPRYPQCLQLQDNRCGNEIVKFR